MREEKEIPVESATAVTGAKNCPAHGVLSLGMKLLYPKRYYSSEMANRVDLSDVGQSAGWYMQDRIIGTWHVFNRT